MSTQPDEKTSGIEWLKELVAAVLGLAIAGVVLTMLWSGFFANQLADHQKELLTVAVGSLGTVIGYYLGRIPGELQAARSNATAAAAQGRLEQSTAENSELRHRIRTVRADVAAAREALTKTPAETTAVESAWRHLQEDRP